MEASEGPGRNKGSGFFGWLRRLLLLAILGAAAAGGWWFYQNHREVEVLKTMIGRLTAEDRVADVWVEEYNRLADGSSRKIRLKILSYGPGMKPLDPVHCDFSVNDVIHFEALVIRLNDDLIMDGKGKSIHFFTRAYALDDHGNRYESCEINRIMDVPGGYRIPTADGYARGVESRLWKSFWEYALDEKKRSADGVKNAQIEAPATRFVPDKIYRLILEHDGGLRIQARPVPEILKGENVKIEDQRNAGEAGH
jgi:hypothetical protein